MRATLSFCVLLVLAGSALAAPDEAPPLRVAQLDTQAAPRWAALPSGERELLAPLQGSWDTMEPESRLKWREIARRFPDMPASRQQRVRDRMEDWAHMSPQQRVQARQTFQGSKGLSREERRAQWEAYQALSPEERAALTRPGLAASRATLPSGAAVRPLGSPAQQPPHQQSGMPKINVMPGMVDRTTLLPLRGPQGAAQVKPADTGGGSGQSTKKK
ncbi:MAG: DUF3106 domain-containing protein [Proteobacteria bacterium]|nr:DUF3106 domain-containing protein [Pseudomonadota bacterium]